MAAPYACGRLADSARAYAARPRSQHSMSAWSPATGALALARSAATWLQCCTGCTTCASRRRRPCRTGAVDCTLVLALHQRSVLGQPLTRRLKPCQSSNLSAVMASSDVPVWCTFLPRPCISATSSDTAQHRPRRPAPGNVRIAVKAVGICRSDVHYLERVGPLPQTLTAQHASMSPDPAHSLDYRRTHSNPLACPTLFLSSLMHQCIKSAEVTPLPRHE